MVKIVEEEEREESVSNVNAVSLHFSPPCTPSILPSTSSHHFHNRRQSHPDSPPPGSPESPSSLSSDEIFHGFSPKLSPPPTSTHPPPRPQQVAVSVPESPSPPSTKDAIVVSRLIQDKPPALVKKTELRAATGFSDEWATPDSEAAVGEQRGGGEPAPRKARASSLPTSHSSRRVTMGRRLALGLRVCEFVACLVSFSVMAADNNRGWALDSFDRYKEFRYCMSVNVMGFAYSGLQCCNLVYGLISGNRLAWGRYGNSFDFMADQILAYLLVSASSSAATRIDDWILNWGSDEFPTMASASVGISFLAFVAFSSSAMISGYLLCTLS